MNKDSIVDLKYRGHHHTIAIASTATLAELRERIMIEVDVDVEKQKIIHDSRVLPPYEDSLQQQTPLDKLLNFTPIAKVALIEHSISEDVLMLDESIERERRRENSPYIVKPTKKQSSVHKRQYFQGFRVLQHHKSPSPEKALELLHKFASDRAIVHIMEKYGWTVGLLSEMEPEGKVGVSPVCILGINKGRGMEISLRLRTDDLKGFRRYDTIRNTLLHELSHMVHDDHNRDFYDLLRELQAEYKQWDWNSRNAGYTLSDGDYYSRPDHDESSQGQGYRLGGAASRGAYQSKLLTLGDGDKAVQAHEETPTKEVSVEIPSSAQTPKQEVNVCTKEQNSAKENEAKVQVGVPTEDRKSSKRTILNEKIVQRIKFIRTQEHSVEADIAFDLTDESTQRVQDATSVIVARLKSSLTELLSSLLLSDAGDEDRINCLCTLQTCITNVVKSPSEMRFRRIRLENAAFQHKSNKNDFLYSKVTRFQGATQYLMASGFEKDPENRILNMHRVDMAVLWIAKETLDETISFITGTAHSNSTSQADS